MAEEEKPQENQESQTEDEPQAFNPREMVNSYKRRVYAKQMESVSQDNHELFSGTGIITKLEDILKEKFEQYNGEKKEKDEATISDKVWEDIKTIGIPVAIGAAIGLGRGFINGGEEAAAQMARQGAMHGLVPAMTVRYGGKLVVDKAKSYIKRKAKPDGLLMSVLYGVKYDFTDPQTKAENYVMNLVRGEETRKFQTYGKMLSPFGVAILFDIGSTVWNILPGINMSGSYAGLIGGLATASRLGDDFKENHELKYELQEDGKVIADLSHDQRKQLVGALAKKWYGKDK